MNEKLDTPPNQNQNHEAIHDELDLSAQNREFLSEYGKLQVAVYDFASHSVEKFKLARYGLKEGLRTPKEIWREQAISRARNAKERAQTRADNAKFATIADRRQLAANAAEIRLLELETAVDQDATVAIKRKQAIKQSYEDRRDVNFASQRKRYQSVLTNKALKKEGLDYIERSEVVGELTKEQADDIGVNALFDKILQRRRDSIESQLESELDPEKIDQLTAKRDKLARMMDELEQDLHQAIADALNSQQPTELEPETGLESDDFETTAGRPDQPDEEGSAEPGQGDHETDPTPETPPAEDQEPEPTSEAPAADGQESEPGAQSEPDDGPDTAKVTPEGIDSDTNKPILGPEPAPEESPEQKRVRQEAEQNRKRTKLIKQLEVIDEGYSYSNESSEADQPKIEKLTDKLFGSKSHSMILAAKTYGQWVGANREAWNNLSQKQRDQREEAWSQLVEWYK